MRSILLLAPLLTVALLAGEREASAADARGDAPGPPPSALVAPVRLERQEPVPDLVWDKRWARFGTLDLVLAGAMGAATVPALLLPVSSSPWRGPGGFDDGARDALRLHDVYARDIARDTSDLLLTVSLTYPFLVDGLAAAYWKRKSHDVALQMAAIDLEALAFNALTSTLVSGLTNRERPYGRLCPANEVDQNQDCNGNKRYRSFYSGHTSTTFTVAGLTCIHHANLPLFGGGVADALPCVTSMLAAAATGMLRVVSDQHYLSDVLLGAAMGTISGLGVPWVLHYRKGSGAAPRDASARPGQVTWTFMPGPLGGSVIGTF